MGGKKMPVELIDLDTGERKRYPSKKKLAEDNYYSISLINYYINVKGGYMCGVNKKIVYV